MLPKKLQIIEILDKGPIHLRQLSRTLNTGMPNVIRYIKQLEKENVITTKSDANLKKIYLNPHPRTIAYLKVIHTERFLSLPNKAQLAINDFLEELETRPLITLLFGSYAKGNYTKNSDIDILLIFQEVKDKERIENLKKRISMRTNTKINPIYFDYNSFQQNFLDKDHKFSEELRETVILLNGINHYYKLLWRFLE